MATNGFAKTGLPKLSNSISDATPARKSRSTRLDPIEAFFGLSTPFFFLGASIYTLLAFSSWSTRWWFSGIPLFCFFLLYGPHNKNLSTTTPAQRLPYVVVVIGVHSILSTSWIAYYIVAGLTWPAVFVLAVANSTNLQKIFRRLLRKLGRDMHFFQDKIACFRLPALLIDVDVEGMLVVQGATVTLSTLTLDCHGIEVSIKIMPGMEIAIRTEKVVVRLGRSVEIGDVYANFKTEMDTGPGSTFAMRRATTIDMMTDGNAPAKINIESLGDVLDKAKEKTETQYPTDDENFARQKYEEKIKWIHDHSGVNVARNKLLNDSDFNFSKLSVKERKAMISSELQTGVSISDPPDWAFAVSEMKSTTPPWVHRMNNRFPVLLRLLLNVIAHLHPVKINGIIATVTGLYASGMLQQAVFKHYKDENKDISKIASRIETWLETGNFVVQISKINGVAQVPVTTIYDIMATIKTSTVQVFKVLVQPESLDAFFDDEDKDPDVISINSVMSSKSTASTKSSFGLTIKDKTGIKQEEDKGISEVARINGVAATFEVPALLLPHHEWLFPEPPASRAQLEETIEAVEEDVQNHTEEDDRLEGNFLEDDFDGRTPAIQPEDSGKDEVIVLCTILASLPAQFNSTILHFGTAMLKATKLIEIQKNVQTGSGSALSDDEDVPPTPTSPKLTLKGLGSKINASMKRTFVAGAMDDAWLAKMVGKAVTKIEGLKGEVGYKMPIPVDLEPRRIIGLEKGTAKKYN